MLGYDVRGGKLHINEKGAETVKLIYHKYVNEDRCIFRLLCLHEYNRKFARYKL